MNKIISLLKISGLSVIGMGILLSLFNLLGVFKDSDKIKVLEWATTTTTGMSVELPGAEKFYKDFPPPPSDEKVTHLTKQVMKSALGGKVQQVSINYMYSNTSRSPYVANLSDLEMWVEKTSYPWLAWALSLLGFIEVLASYVLEKIKISRTRRLTRTR